MQIRIKAIGKISQHGSHFEFQDGYHVKVNNNDFRNIIFEFLDLRKVLLDTTNMFLCKLGVKLLEKYAEIVAILNLSQESKCRQFFYETILKPTWDRLRYKKYQGHRVMGCMVSYANTWTTMNVTHLQYTKIRLWITQGQGYVFGQEIST